MIALGCLVLALACREGGAPLPAREGLLELLARPTVAGADLDVAALAGKVVVVSFWSPG